MLYPNGAVPMDPAAVQVSSPNFFSIPCTDDSQNPATGNRCMQFTVKASFIVENNGGSFYYNLNLSSLNQSGYLDKMVCLEINDLNQSINSANFSATTGFTWLVCDQSNQIIVLAECPSITQIPHTVITDLLLPSPTMSLQFQTTDSAFTLDLFYNFVFSNFRRDRTVGNSQSVLVG